MILSFPLRALATSVACVAVAPAAWSASFHGTVRLPDRRPAFGAMVCVFNAAKNQKQTVYTAADGRYAIVTPYSGSLDVRARLANYDDAQVTVEAPADATNVLDLTLRSFSDAQGASGALSASAHNAMLPWRRAGDRHVFVSQCNYCHQIGNSTTRAPRSHDAWLATINKMEGYLAMVTKAQSLRFASTLEKGFDGRPVKATHGYGPTPELARAKVEVNPLPASDLPRGSLFSGMHLAIGIFTGSHGPHSMAQTKDGRIWITNALSSTIMSFDPKTKRFETYPVPGDALYPHMIRVDGDDVLWFTIVASNQVGRFDPKTEQMTVMRLPSNGFFRWVTDMLFPTLLRIASWFPDEAYLLDFSHHRFLGYNVLAFPYSIDVNPKDGSVWYAKLYANRIGRIDPKTLEVTEYETPYALNVHRPTGEVWMAAANSDRVLRLSPRTQTFMNYPSPTRVTFLCDFAFTRDGKVCSSQSNLPAYAIEGAVPSYLCIDPTGGERDRATFAVIRAGGDAVRALAESALRSSSRPCLPLRRTTGSGQKRSLMPCPERAGTGHSKDARMTIPLHSVATGKAACPTRPQGRAKAPGPD